MHHWDADSASAFALSKRPARPADHESENKALLALANSVAAQPNLLHQKLAELVAKFCRADSGGVSVLTVDDAGDQAFAWLAVTGEWRHYVGGKMPRHGSPCGAVLDHEVCLLFEDTQGAFPAASNFNPPIYEALLAPVYVRGQIVGTVWAVTHRPEHRFDAEDMRLLKSVANFASLDIFAPQERSFAPVESNPMTPGLTAKQQAVLALILAGKPNKIIAFDLGMSQRTAENHRAAIMKKMGVSSVAALVLAVVSQSSDPTLDLQTTILSRMEARSQ